MHSKKEEDYQSAIEKKKTRWIIVANRAEARIYSTSGQNALELIKTFDHPEGRMREQDIKEGKPGRSFSSWSGSHSRHAMSSEVSITRQDQDAFADQLAEFINKGRVDHQYDELVLIADPKFLGILLASLDDNCKKLVRETLDKNLLQYSDKELGQVLQDLGNSHF